MQKYVTEFIGTFFLVFTIGLAVQGAGDLAPLAIGSSLMVMVYMGGHVSGAHYNPAVSTAILIRGKLDLKDYLPYLVAQLLGAVAAGSLVYVARGQTTAIAPDLKNFTIFGALLIEILYTFALALVVLNVATSKKTAGNSFYGLAIGFTIAAGAFAGGSVSGGAYNPAVGTGLTLAHVFFGGGGFEHLWLYIVGPILGACAAALVFKFQEGEESAPTNP